MRILQISSAETFGGGEKHLADLADGLTEKGHKVFVALRKENEWEDRLGFLPAENIFHVPLRNSLDIFSGRNLAQIMRRKEIEIVHAHPARDYPLAGLAVRLYPKARFVLTRHVLFPMKSLHKFSLGNVSRAIAVSAAVEANLQKIFPKEKIALIPNGIGIGKFSDADRQASGKDFRFQHDISFDKSLIGTVGELKKLKGQEDFVLAANEIHKKFPETHFVVVGRDNSFDQSFRRGLKRLVKVFGLEENFTFLDWVEDTTPLLAALDIFVSASHTESFGLAILEAMAGGTAVVAAETEGAKGLIDDDFSGRLVPVKNPVALAAAVVELLEDAEKREIYGRNARKSAGENFSLERMIDETESLYREVLSPNQRAPENLP
jgi:L-malate glycosyltransferase